MVPCRELGCDMQSFGLAIEVLGKILERSKDNASQDT